MFIIFFGCGCRCHCQFANVKEKAKVRQMIGPLLNFGTTYHSPLIHQFPRKGSQLHFTICFDLYLQFTTKNHRQTNNPGVPRSSSLSILVAAVKYNLAMHTPDFRFSQMNSSPVTNRCCVACGYVTTLCHLRPNIQQKHCYCQAEQAASLRLLFYTLCLCLK